MMDINKIRELVETRDYLFNAVRELWDNEESNSNDNDFFEPSKQFTRLEKKYKDFLTNEWASAELEFKAILSKSKSSQKNEIFFFSDDFFMKLIEINANTEGGYLVREQDKHDGNFYIKCFSDVTGRFDKRLNLSWEENSGYIVFNEYNPQNSIFLSKILQYLQNDFDFVIKTNGYHYFNIKS